MSDPFASLDLLTPSRQGNTSYMTTPAAPYQQQQQQSLNKQPSMHHQNVMSQFQTSNTIQTNMNGPARTQYMSNIPSVSASPFGTTSASIANPFADPAPAFPYASQLSTQPHPSNMPTNPFNDPFGTHAPPIPASPYINTNQFTTCPSATVQDFDPFSPKGSTPRMPFDFPTPASPAASTLSPRQATPFVRATQEGSRRNLDVAAFQTAAAAPRRHSVKDILDAEKMSISESKKAQQYDNGFTSSNTSDIFAANTFSNLDDDFNPRGAASRRNSLESQGSTPILERGPSMDLSHDMEDDEYEVVFDYGSKLGVLMERIDTYVKDNKQDRKRELAIVKLVVEGGAADRIGVKVGSIIRGINNKNMEYETYNTVLELIKTAPRPMTIRLKERGDARETTQGAVLTRISSGTFSVGNLTAGNAKWDSKYFAFGGAKMDVLQLFVSRAAYHECVIALYEKRQVSTQIQSFRLYRDHKLSPIKSKIYKGYGNLHYFSLTVPSLRFVAAKFASENYDTIKNRNYTTKSQPTSVPKWKADRAEKFRKKNEQFDGDKKKFKPKYSKGNTSKAKDSYKESNGSSKKFKQQHNRVQKPQKKEEDMDEAPISLHEVFAQKEAEWNEMRKIRTLPPKSPAKGFPKKSSPEIAQEIEDATTSITAKKDQIIQRQKAERLKNKQSRIFDGIRAPPQDIVSAVHTYEEPDDPRDSEPRSLNVAVIGRPNAGKSSLMNALLGFNVSAVSSKYNTTRDRVLGVLTEGDAQIAFYDTPGLVNLKDTHTYVRSLAVTAAETMPSVDLSLLVVDAVKRLDDQALEALKGIAISSARESAPVVLVMNKMDLVGPAERVHVAKRIGVLSEMIEDAFEKHSPKDEWDDFDDEDEEDDDEFDEDDDDDDEDDEDYDDDDEEFDDEDFDDDDDFDEEDFEEENKLEIEPTQFLRENCFKVSAFKDKDVQKLRDTLLELAVERPWMYNSRMKSDRSDLELVTEIIREKLYRRFNQELPYMIEQENRGWTPFSDKSIRIDQDLWVPSERHIKTLLGKKGDTLREIGTAARKDIQKLLGQKVHLYLNVRAKSGR